MNKKEKTESVRVAVESSKEILPEQHPQDFGDLLEENLALLARVEHLTKLAEKSAEDNKKASLAQHKAEQELAKQQLKNKFHDGYDSDRRMITWLNALTALVLLFGPAIVWLKYFPKQPWLIALGAFGLALMALNCSWIDELADKEEEAQAKGKRNE